jgi:hypothetical protein
LLAPWMFFFLVPGSPTKRSLWNDKDFWSSQPAHFLFVYCIDSTLHSFFISGLRSWLSGVLSNHLDTKFEFCRCHKIKTLERRLVWLWWGILMSICMPC